MIGSISPDEESIVGSWVAKDQGIEADESCLRIGKLISDELKVITTDDWCGLYQDPVDGRYWELTYPQSEMHGGGPPKLTHIDYADAKKKYGLKLESG